jgi:hypothetical protein
VAILWAGFRDQAFSPLAGSNAKTFYGRLGGLRSYGADRLDSRRPIVLLWVRGTLARGLAAQFCSAVNRSGARQRCKAIVFALICSRFFEMSNSLSFLFGLLCALDPCQLVWERYVMTETFSLVVYVLVVYWSLTYLRDRRLWQLAVVQALSVLLIDFRMSCLLVVQVCTILLPLIAFARCALATMRSRSEVRASKTGVLTIRLTHLIASVAMMFVMHAPTSTRMAG